MTEKILQIEYHIEPWKRSKNFKSMKKKPKRFEKKNSKAYIINLSNFIFYVYESSLGSKKTHE